MQALMDNQVCPVKIYEKDMQVRAHELLWSDINLNWNVLFCSVLSYAVKVLTRPDLK